MKVLLTGATGYIGRRLLPELVARGHYVICPVRDERRFDYEDFSPDFLKSVEVVEVDFHQEETMGCLPEEFDIAFYLIHSLNSRNEDFRTLEENSAKLFVNYCNSVGCKQIVYLGGIVNSNNPSKQLESRLNVENILKAESVAPVTVLRSSIIIGSGSKSFEIIRDLVEKLPLMVAPRWLNKKVQPIGVANVLEYLLKVMNNDPCLNKTFDIAGKSIITYKEMLETYAKVRGLKRLILVVPVLSPRLSSLWLYFVTNTPFNLARNLVDSIKDDSVARDSNIDDLLDIRCKQTYQQALEGTLSQTDSDRIVSSWKDTFLSPEFNSSFIVQHEAPKHGVFREEFSIRFSENHESVLDNLWQIGGTRGWYYGNALWRVRGILDLLVGGVGLRRGRRSQTDLKSGDSLDFWRVLHADKDQGKLLLFAEMKLPGEGWLEFRIRRKGSEWELTEISTFRPKGLWGRVYWWVSHPLHQWVLNGMIKKIVAYGNP